MNDNNDQSPQGQDSIRSVEKDRDDAREQLAGTVQALADKANVKSHAKDKVTQQTTRLKAVASDAGNKATQTKNEVSSTVSSVARDTNKRRKAAGVIASVAIIASFLLRKRNKRS
jgi:hypothetical protein